MHDQASSEQKSEWDAMSEQSWYYYLSDIAYRRITNRTIASLYNIPKEQWLECLVSRLFAIATELDSQVLQWWATIPGSPEPTVTPDTDELTYMLYLNYADLRERIWRPFVYIAVHSASSQLSEQVVTGTQRCLEMSLGLLQNARLKHRHHGCWQTIRCMFSKALVVLAAAKCGHVQIAEDWRIHAEAFQDYMRYWQDEALDIGAANRALSSLLSAVRPAHAYGSTARGVP